MVMKDRKNVTILNNAYDKLKKKYEESNTSLSMTQWLSEKIELTIEKDIWMSRFSEEISYSGCDGKAIMLRDSSRGGELIEVILNDGKPYCINCNNKTRCMHVLYAQGIPEIALLKETENEESSEDFSSHNILAHKRF